MAPAAASKLCTCHVHVSWGLARGGGWRQLAGRLPCLPQLWRSRRSLTRRCRHPQVKKILQLLRLRQINNAVFIKVRRGAFAAAWLAVAVRLTLARAVWPCDCSRPAAPGPQMSSARLV